MEIKLGDTILHKPSGKTGRYIEHANEGEGYMMLTDDGKVIFGKYEDFELVEKHYTCEDV